MSHLVTQQVLQRLEIMPEILQQQVLEFIARIGGLNYPPILAILFSRKQP